MIYSIWRVNLKKNKLDSSRVKKEVSIYLESELEKERKQENMLCIKTEEQGGFLLQDLQTCAMVKVPTLYEVYVGR